MVDRSDPFAPFDPGEAEAPAPAAPVDDFEPLPVPEGSVAPDHPKLGKPADRWAYTDAAGNLEGFTCRFDRPDGKTVRPLRYGRQDGRTGWFWRGWGEARPLYGLRDLITHPDAPVLVVEGEKTVDRARLIFPDHVVVTAMGGAQSPGRTDWSPLKGRTVMTWPDNDEPGAAFAQAVAKLVHKAGAASVRIVQVPDRAPPKWDLADSPPKSWTDDTLRVALAGAEEWRPDFEAQGAFLVQHRPSQGRVIGIYREIEAAGEDGKASKAWVRFGSYLEVLAETRDGAGEAWGRMLAIHDRDGTRHHWAMPMEILAGDSADLRRGLMRRGFVPVPGRAAREALEAYVMSWSPSRRVRCVERLGWHGRVFVLPDRTYGPTAADVVAQLPGLPPEFAVRGTIKGWCDGVARLAVGNSRIVFAMSAAFAGPLLHLAGQESGGFNYKGASSGGKTTTLRCTSSVWGSPIHTWRATGNGMEGIAAAANDTALVLDELGQVDGRDADVAGYLLSNGAGKARARRDGTARPAASWRVLFLSSGEVGLADKLGEVGRKAKAGQLVRVVDIPADAGAGMGAFEELHSYATPAEFADALRLGSEAHAGHAGRAFLEAITTEEPAVLASTVREANAVWLSDHLPAGCDGQVNRVAARFALVATAGELATGLGILPWPKGEASRAAARCFNDWLADRGGTGAHELTAGLAQVRAFIEAHGSSRFEDAWRAEDAGGDIRVSDRPVVNRVGFRRLEDGAWTFYVLPEAWRSEVCRGLDAAMIAREMRDRGWLRPGDGKNLAKKERVPGQPPGARYFVVLPDFLAGDGA